MCICIHFNVYMYVFYFIKYDSILPQFFFTFLSQFSASRTPSRTPKLRSNPQAQVHHQIKSLQHLSEQRQLYSLNYEKYMLLSSFFH